jgi:4-hydroxy-3-methylbut-2-en-1-yl diphosphate reductase
VAGDLDRHEVGVVEPRGGDEAVGAPDTRLLEGVAVDDAAGDGLAVEPGSQPVEGQTVDVDDDDVLPFRREPRCYLGSEPSAPADDDVHRSMAFSRARRDTSNQSGMAAGTRPDVGDPAGTLVAMAIPHTLLLAAPRGFCAGVDRAVLIVEKALEAFGPPVYVRHEIVHNTHVVNGLRERGAVFIEDEREVPEDAVVVFSAHGSPASAYESSRRLGHTLIDATCPLVTKVHAEARRYEQRGWNIVLIGHDGHQEVKGTMGQVGHGTITLVETPEDVDRLDLDPDDHVAYITQTTLSMDDTAEVVDRLRNRFPVLHQPKSDDICYATQNRQDAVKRLVDEGAGLVLVVGSQTSSNSKRLVEVGGSRGVPAHLVDDVSQIDPAWFDGVGVVGLTSGASAPEVLVEEVVAWFRDRGTEKVATVHVVDEDVEFALPPILARKLSEVR